MWQHFHSNPSCMKGFWSPQANQHYYLINENMGWADLYAQKPRFERIFFQKCIFLKLRKYNDIICVGRCLLCRKVHLQATQGWDCSLGRPLCKFNHTPSQCWCSVQPDVPLNKSKTDSKKKADKNHSPSYYINSYSLAGC